MDAATARRLVVASMVVSGGVITYDLLRGQAGGMSGREAFRVIWAMGVLFLLLTVAADTIPALAGPFAGLVALSILIGRSAAVDQIANVIPAKGGSK